MAEIKKLTEVACKNAKPKEKPYMMPGGNNLYLLIMPAGSKLWRLKYRFKGKQCTLALQKGPGGSSAYPKITLAEANRLRDEANNFLAAGIDPAAARRKEKQATEIEAQEEANTFAHIAEQWCNTNLPHLSEKHAIRLKENYLQKRILPAIGSKPINTLKPQDFLDFIKPIEGNAETAHKVLQLCGQVMEYARTAGMIPYNPAKDLGKNLRPVKVEHRAAITKPEEIAVLLHDIDDYKGRSPIVGLYLKILARVFVRPGELRLAQWQEFDFVNMLWRIPAERMKAKREHTVPLAPQVITLLEELKQYTGHGQYLFPGQRSASATMSDNTARQALRDMGYDGDVMTAHGFRAMASTRLNEMGFDERLIEAALAHKDRNAVRAAYSRSTYLNERIPMMQAWADYLDELKSNPAK